MILKAPQTLLMPEMWKQWRHITFSLSNRTHFALCINVWDTLSCQ